MNDEEIRELRAEIRELTVNVHDLATKVAVVAQRVEDMDERIGRMVPWSDYKMVRAVVVGFVTLVLGGAMGAAMFRFLGWNATK